MRRALRTVLVLSSTLFLANCAATKQVVTELETIFVFEPEELQHCADEPTAPAEGSTQGAWGDYIHELRNAGADCRDRVKRGKVWADERRNDVHRVP